jgi:hypothetical protein
MNYHHVETASDASWMTPAKKCLECHQMRMAREIGTQRATEIWPQLPNVIMGALCYFI